MSISQRLIAGFASLLVLFALAVGLTCVEIAAVRTDATLLNGRDGPRRNNAQEIASRVDRGISALQTWMLTARPAMKQERSAHWAVIDQRVAEMDALMARDASPELVQRWQSARDQLKPLRVAEDEVERVANSPGEQPAVTILNNEVMPLFNVMGAQLSAMMDEEARLEATPERKELLHQMAEFRGPLGLAGANLRAYLATGDYLVKAAFELMFDRTWTGHEYMTEHRHLLTPSQVEAMDKVEAAWGKFLPLPEKLITIRESDEWNVRDRLMSTSVLPRIAGLREALEGSGGANASGLVGMVSKQFSDRSESLTVRLDRLQQLSVALLAAGLAIAATLGTLTTRAIVKPLRAMTGAMRQLAARDFATEIPGAGRKDEIGAMAAAVQAFQRDGIEKLRLETETAETSRQRESRQALVENHTNDFGATISSVLATLGGSAATMRQAASSMADAVDQTRGQSATTVIGAEASARSLASVAAATEQLTSSVDEIARQVAHASATSREAVSRAETTGRTVQGLSDAARQIGDIVRLITDIAGKTNLLALNATIEAARAGEAGRGFAVVASEVKQLAAQTTAATEQIGTQVSAIQDATGQATEAMRGVGESIMRMDEVAAVIATAVEQQGLSAREIANSVQAVSIQNEGATGAMREVSHIAERASGSSQMVLTASSDLANVAQTIQQKVDQFLSVVRA